MPFQMCMQRSFSVVNAVQSQSNSQTVQPTQTQFKVNVRTAPLQTQKELLEEKVQEVKAQTLPVAYIPDAIEKVENPTVSARRWNIRYSAHKLRAVALCVAGKQIFDAESMAASIDKKGAKFVGNALKNARAVAERRGL